MAEPQTPLDEKDLVERYSLSTSEDPYVQEVRKAIASLNSGLLRKLGTIRRPILWSGRNVGVGYLSASLRHDKAAEILYTTVIADAFKNRELETEPLIVPIDAFYSYVSGNASLVTKTEVFNDRFGTKGRYAVILTGFSDSQVFTPSALDDIPSQNNAGLKDQGDEFGKKLLRYAGAINFILEKDKGNIKRTIDEIALAQKAEDARLLLATSLLLQDMQKWQNLWYEGRNSGTPLYIIAPKTFHDSMNRLNFSWGHGIIDYSNRAMGSLGANDIPPFEDEQEYRYQEQGLSYAEFRARVEPFIERILKQEEGK